MGKKILYMAGWAVTVLLQIIVAGAIVFLFSGLWPIKEITTMGKFSLIIGTVFGDLSPVSMAWGCCRRTCVVLKA